MEEAIIKINKIKSQFFQKINKMDKPQPNSSRKKERRINKIKVEKGEVTTDNAEIQRITRDHCEQLQGNKMDNLEEMERFLEKFNLPRLNQEEIEIMNNITKITEIEAVIKKISQNTKAQNEFGIVPSSAIFKKSFRRTGISSFINV